MVTLEVTHSPGPGRILEPQATSMEAGRFERYCQAIINVINSRGFDFESEDANLLKSIISPDWCAKSNCTPFTISFDQQVEVWRQMTLDFPDMYFELIGVDCNIHKMHRTAEVIMRTHMVQGKERFLTACLLTFMFSDGRWLWYRHSGIRGIANVD